MASPERSEWRTVWLGPDDPNFKDGWLPVEGEVRMTRLATFERKLTIGDATRDSDDFISSWVIGDFTGGGQIFDINEGSDIGRFWFGVADTRFINQLSLPPEVVEYSFPVAQTSGVAIPVGDVPRDYNQYVQSGTGGVAQTMVFCAWYNNQMYEFRNTSSGTVAGASMQSMGAATYTEQASSAATLVTASMDWLKPNQPGVSYTIPSTGQTVLVVVCNNEYSYVMGDKMQTGGSNNAVPLYYKTASMPLPLKLPNLISAAVWKDTLYVLTKQGDLYSTSNPILKRTTTSGVNSWSGYFEPVLNAKGDTLKLHRYQTPMHLAKHFVNMEMKLLGVTDEQVWVYDPTNKLWAESPAKWPPSAMYGAVSCQWRNGEDLWVTVGPDVLKYTNSQVIIPNSGPMREDGLPYEMSIVSNPVYAGSQVVSLTAEYNNLYALMYHNNGNTYPDMSLFAWTGSGWHCLWQGGKSSYPIDLWTCLSTAQASGNKNIPEESFYRLWIGTYENKLYGMDLRKSFHNARVGARAGIDRFSAKVKAMGAVDAVTDPWVETGRFDANMRGFKKLASHLIVDMEFANATNYLKVYYQTDADLNELTNYTMQSSGNLTWHEIPTVVNKIGKNIIVLPDATSGFNEGIAFDWIRFKFVLVGEGGTLTPIVSSMQLAYTKIPQDTASFVLTVPLPRETFMGQTGQEIAERLEAMAVSQQFMKFVHQNKTYRVRIAGISGADSTGDDYAGARTLNLIEVKGA